MNKKKSSIIAALICLLFLNSCVKDVKDAVDEAAQALACTNSVKEFDDKNDANPNRSCTEIVADINDIEKTCAEYLADSVKDEFAELRSQCEGS